MTAAPEKMSREPKLDPEKLKFLGLVSHELKTPLNAIIGFSNLIESQALGPVGNADYVEFAREIQTSGQALLRLVDELITSAQAEDGGLKAVESHVDLNAVLADALAGVEVTARQKGVRISVEGEGRAPAIWADARAVGQAIGAVIDNAVKFTPDNGRVAVSLEMGKDGTFRLAVSDTGTGFDPAMRETLAELFRQGDDRIARDYQGAGIGLYLCRQFMSLHGGAVEIGDAPNGGARVVLIFPEDRLVFVDDDQDLTVMADDEDAADAVARLELEHAGKTFNVFSGAQEFSIGRSAGGGGTNQVDLPVEDRRASRTHAQIIFSDGNFHLVDASTRGTYVQKDGVAAELVHMNVSAPLAGTGVIALGDAPDAEGIALVRYRLAPLSG